MNGPKHGSNNDGKGATQAKGGDLVKALSRPAGMSATMSAMESRTRSRHAGTGKHNKWEGPSCGWGDDKVHGY